MKKNTRILPLCLFLLGFSSLIAQDINWSFHADAGLSHIYTNRELINTDDDIFIRNSSEYENAPAFSFSYGAIGDIKLFKNLSMSTGLSILKMKGTHEITNQGLISINGTAVHRDYFTRNNDQSLNFALPLAIKFKLTKFNIKLGVQTFYLLQRKTDFKTTTIANNTTYILNESSNNSPFKKFDYGLIGGISYKLHKQFSIGMNVYWGLNNIIESSVVNNNYLKYSRKNQRLSIGLSYHLDHQNL